MQIVQNAMAGNFQLDGAYIQELTAQPGIPQGPATNQIIVVGTAEDGPMNVPTPFSAQADLYANFGEDTTLVKGLVRSALTAMPDCQNFIGIRTGDGTQANATISILDVTTPTPGTLITLTAINPGKRANKASAIVQITSGTLTSKPVCSITINWPNDNPQVFNGIVAYATTAFDAPTFKANAIAAINGTKPNSVKSTRFVASAGVSTANVLANTLFTGTGGLNGDSSVTDATNVGTDAQVGSTGMYAARGLAAGGQVVLSGLSDPTQFANVAAFCLQEGCIGWETFAAGTTTAAAITAKSTNNMSNDNMCLVLDWLDVQDAYQGLEILVSPLSKAAGIVASQAPFMYVGNKPANGTTGVVSTERMTLGNLGQAEAAQREANGIMWIGKTPNGVLGLPHGLASSGVQLNDVRMRNYLAFAVGAILGQYVGAMLETSLPIAQADENDARLQAKAALNAFFLPMTTPGQRQISAYQVIINDQNNPQSKRAQGFLIAGVQVTTLTGVQFAVGLLEVGSTVNIFATPLS